MKTIIITGGIGSGKTHISSYFRKMYGIPIFNTDIISKNLMSYDTYTIKNVKRILGKESYNKDGSLNKEYIKDTIYNSPSLRKELTEYISLKVSKEFKKFKKEYGNCVYCIMECAIFFEEEFFKKIKYNYVIGVIADEDIRITRIQKRSSWSNEHIQSVINIQLSPEEIINLSDSIIVNNDLKESEIMHNIEFLHELLLKKFKSKFYKVDIKMIAYDCSLFPYGHCKNASQCYPCEFNRILK